MAKKQRKKVKRYVKIDGQYIPIVDTEYHHFVVIYEKVGRKYVPVNVDIDYFSFFTKGDYLIRVTDCGRSAARRVHRDLNPSNEIDAIKLSEKVGDIVRRKLKVQPARKRITKAQRLAYDKFMKAMGDEVYALEYCALCELIGAVKEVICDEYTNY